MFSVSSGRDPVFLMILETFSLAFTANLKRIHYYKNEIMNHEVLKLNDVFNKSKILIYDVHV